jgi:hypothetical protein
VTRLALALAALVAAVSGCSQFWVAPTGSDSNSGSEQQPFRTFAKACQVADDPDGDVAHVEAGVYPAQAVPGSCDRLIFAADGPVTVANQAGGGLQATLDVAGDDLAFVGVDVDSNGAARIGVHSSGDRISYRNLSIGDVADEKGVLVSGTDVEFDDVLFHDVLLTSAGAARDVHNECVYAIVVERFRVTDSTFRDCSTMDLMLTYGTWWDPLPPDYGNGTIARNDFGCPRFAENSGCHYYALLFNGAMPSVHGWTVRDNSFEAGTDVGLDQPFEGGLRCGNAGATIGGEWKGACPPG